MGVGAVDRARDAYRGQSKTNARDAHVMADPAWMRSDLVRIQNRCRVRRYSDSHVTSNRPPFSVGHRNRAIPSRARFV
jgi:hypothetical protein